jgi:hypothetical protein
MSDGRRLKLTLDGAWDFMHGDSGVWREAIVPNPWQAQFADLRQVSGRAVYRRQFGLPDAAGKLVVLHFGAVSYWAEVKVNGQVLGSHEGGYLPFEFVIPASLLRKENTVEVTCLLPDGNPDTAPDFPFGEIPHGKQSWYGPLGGIWQSVTVELRDPCHLDHCAITADRKTGQVNARLTFSDAAVGSGAQLTVLGTDGQAVAMKALDVNGKVEDCTLQVADPALWSPDAPNLYTLRVDLNQGETRDITTHTFGFRSIEARNGQILLNGAPFFMRAALDQDYYPEGICTPPSVEFLEDQIHKAKALGLNMLRCHIKAPDPRYYEVADRLGMLIWTDNPNVGHFTAASARRMRETMEGMLRRDGNHPCIVIWSIINEDWGTRLCEDASHRQWLIAEFDWLKAADPTRLVVDNSPCHGNFHVKTDINDYHYYRSVPERRAEWDALTAEFAAGADWTYSPFGDAVRAGDEPLIVSEFGVWGLPHPDQVKIDGAEPWWMETGSTWGDGAAYPHGIQNRYAAMGLDTVFGSFDKFIEAVHGYQFMNLKYEIESMRKHPSIMGYVITELTDVHWESNGLLDMNRNPRSFHDKFGSINADVVIVPRIPHYSGVAGQAWSFGLGVASGAAALSASELRWETDTGEGGVIALGPVAPLAMADAGLITLTLPATSENRMLRLEFTLTADGQEIARNNADIALYAPRQTQGLPRVSSPFPGLAARAAALGYTVVAPEEADVILVHGLNQRDLELLQSGKRYVVLADGLVKTQKNLRVDIAPREQPFIPIVDAMPGLPRGGEGQMPNLSLIARHGTMWRGDWIAGFGWIRRKGAFASLPGGPLLDLSFDRVVPHHVMGGVRAWEYAGAVHSGTMVGWVQKPAALIAERRVGRGVVIASTFRLCVDEPGADPVAGALFDALVMTAATADAE